MKISNVELRLKVEVTNKDGKVRKIIDRCSKSFTIAFLQAITIQMKQSTMNIIDVANASNLNYADDEQLKANGASSDDTIGIILGTGTTAPTNANYNIETIIDHGTGAGELSYGEQAFTDAVEVGANVDLLLTRSFTNGSGGIISPTEAGVIVNTSLNHAYRALIVRDTFSAVAVGNGEIVTVSYTFRTTV